MAKPTQVEGLGPDTPLKEAGSRFVLARLADVRRQEREVRTLRTAAVHDMRVGARRLRAAVGLFSGRKRGKLDRRIKRLQDALGAVRDLQIQLQWLRTVRPASAVAELITDLERRLDEKKKELRPALKEWRQRTAPAVHQYASTIEGKGRLGGKRMCKRLIATIASASARLAALRRSPDPRRAHRVRIEMKKLRYEIELLSPAWRSSVLPALERAIQLQRGLGELHDLDVRIELLTGFLASRKDSLPQGLSAVLRSVERARRRQAQGLGRLLRRSIPSPFARTSG